MPAERSTEWTEEAPLWRSSCLQQARAELYERRARELRRPTGKDAKTERRARSPKDVRKERLLMGTRRSQATIARLERQKFAGNELAQKEATLVRRDDRMSELCKFTDEFRLR